MLGHRLRRGPWEQRFSNLSSTRHLCGQFRRLTISNGNDATNRSAPLPSITAEIEKGQRKPSRELKVGKDCQRLSKVCGQQEWGIAARRKAETIIADGRVTVNGECVTIPQTLVRFKRDNIAVDGMNIKNKPPKLFYFAVNKPEGYTCSSVASMDDNGSRQRIVLDLFKEWLEEQRKKPSKGKLPPRLFTVGRLDKDSRGLIFVTNDGQWAQQISHPSSGLQKEYVVHTVPEATMSDIQEIGKGCDVDGRFVEPVGVMKETEFLRVVVEEGRNREVRTLVENAGLLVKSLKRVRVGGYRMPSGHKPGKIRVLQAHERRRLMNPGSLN